MKILVNHIGYDFDSVKQAVAACRADERIDESAVFRLMRDGSTVLEISPGARTEVHGWKGRFFYLLDFSDLSEAGEYYISFETGDHNIESFPFRISKNVIAESTISDLLFYFKSQRCTWKWNESDKRVPFFGTREGFTDVSGGWYDAAGDYSKYLTHLSYANYLNPQQTPLVVWALINTYTYSKSAVSFYGNLLEERAAEEAVYGADFLMRMQDSEGYFYTNVFDQWSKDVDRRQIAAFEGMKGIFLENYQAGYRKGGGLAIAALAAVSASGLSGDYPSDDYLKAAVKGWKHLQIKNIEYLDNGRENIIDDYCALLAAVELFKIQKDECFLDEAAKRVKHLNDLYDHDKGCWMVEHESERPYFHAVEAGLPVIALIEYCKITDPKEDMHSTAVKLIKTAVSDMLKISGGRQSNPFLLCRQWVQAVDEPDSRVSYFMPHNNETGYWWQGENARLASIACAFRRALSFFEDEKEKRRILEFADAQISWILGCNPYDICMMQGHGRNNPAYEKHYPNAPGGICNGITAGLDDEKDIDFLPAEVEGRGDYRWRWSEQWLPHAAWFMLAAIETKNE